MCPQGKVEELPLFLPNLPDVYVIVFFSVMFLPNVPHQALRALEECILVPSTGAKDAGKATILTVALHNEAVSDKIGSLFNDLVVVFRSFDALVDNFLDNLPRSALLHLQNCVASWALIATTLAECMVK